MKKKNKQLVIRIILFILISLILGFGIYNLNARTLLNNSMPMPFGIGLGVVMSGSMEPDLSIDDLIVVVKDDNIEVGEVIVYQDKNILVVHEVIKVDADQITTQGKANDDPDDPISVKDVKGRVAFHIDGLGKLVNVIRTPVVTVIILAIAVFMLYKSYSLEKKEKSDNAEKIEQIKKEIEILKKEITNK